MKLFMNNLAKARPLTEGDTIIFDPNNQLLSVWDKHGRILSFKMSVEDKRDDKLSIRFIKNKSDFAAFCQVLAQINELDIKVMREKNERWMHELIL